MREEDISDRAHALPYGYVALAGLRMREEDIQDRGHALPYVMQPLENKKKGVEIHSLLRCVRDSNP